MFSLVFKFFSSYFWELIGAIGVVSSIGLWLVRRLFQLCHSWRRVFTSRRRRAPSSCTTFL